MQRCLRWQVSRTRRAGEALLPRGSSASAVRRAGVAGTARWRKCGPAAERRANGVAYSADNRASDARRRLLEVLPRGLRRLWDGAPCPVTLAQFPARQHLAGKIRFLDPALYYNYPLFTRLIHLLGRARLKRWALALPTARPDEGICIRDTITNAFLRNLVSSRNRTPRTFLPRQCVLPLAAAGDATCTGAAAKLADAGRQPRIWRGWQTLHLLLSNSLSNGSARCVS